MLDTQRVGANTCLSQIIDAVIDLQDIMETLDKLRGRILGRQSNDKRKVDALWLGWIVFVVKSWIVRWQGIDQESILPR